MNNYDDLKELFRAEMGILKAEIRGQSEDIREVKEAIKGFLGHCETRRADLSSKISDLRQEQMAMKAQQRVFIGALVIALTGAVKGVFDWLTK